MLSLYMMYYVFVYYVGSLFGLCMLQECSAGALANLAANKKYSMEIAIAGGIQSLVKLINNCKFLGVREQVPSLSQLRGTLHN